VGSLRRVLDALEANTRSAKRARAHRYRTEESRWAVVFPARAAGRFRDALAWKEVVSWTTPEDASSRYAAWKRTHQLTDADLRDKVRIEVRGDQDSEMRVLAAPDFVAVLARARD
jgi:hypothetical protein